MLLVTSAVKTVPSISQNGINEITLHKQWGNHLNMDIINASKSICQQFSGKYPDPEGTYQLLDETLSQVLVSTLKPFFSFFVNFPANRLDCWGLWLIELRALLASCTVLPHLDVAKLENLVRDKHSKPTLKLRQLTKGNNSCFKLTPCLQTWMIGRSSHWKRPGPAGPWRFPENF